MRASRSSEVGNFWADPEWGALLCRTQAAGKTLGIGTEADMERLSDEFRQVRLQSTAR